MYKPSIEQLERAMKKKGYPLSYGEYELNITGIRNVSAKPNSFDDLICVFYKDEYGDKTILFFPCTTDPGFYWLEHPLNSRGCAIMKEGHYPDVYKIGVHRGYKALEQIGNIRFIRDNNKDTVLDFNGKMEDEIFQVIKANIHHAAYPENSVVVDKWSAGCQVINKGWNEFIELCGKSRLITGRNRFSYTLLNINDVKSA